MSVGVSRLRSLVRLNKQRLSQVTGLEVQNVLFHSENTKKIFLDFYFNGNDWWMWKRKNRNFWPSWTEWMAPDIFVLILCSFSLTLNIRDLNKNGIFSENVILKLKDQRIITKMLWVTHYARVRAGIDEAV